MLIEPVDDDPEREFNDEEKRRLSINLANLTRKIRMADCKNSEYISGLFRDWHYQLFDGVREHAGRFRSKDYGEDILNFGPHRSTHRNKVADEIDAHTRHGRSLLSEFSDRELEIDRPEFVRNLLRAALYMHAMFIKIHPFRDGNGRVGRLIITYFLARHNLPSLALEVPRLEYIDCLNHFYKTKCTDIDPLYDLALRIFRNQIDV